MVLPARPQLREISWGTAAISYTFELFGDPSLLITIHPSSCHVVCMCDIGVRLRTSSVCFLNKYSSTSGWDNPSFPSTDSGTRNISVICISITVYYVISLKLHRWNIPSCTTDLLIHLAGRVLVPLNALSDLSLLGPLRIFFGYSVISLSLPLFRSLSQCVCVLWTAFDLWHPMNARLDWELGSLEARSVPSALRWRVETDAAPLQKTLGYIQVELLLRISVVSNRWHTWLCDPIFDVRRSVWETTWCSLRWRREADVPLQRRQWNPSGMMFPNIIHWCTSLVVKTMFLLLCFSHALFKTLTNQTTIRQWPRV